MKNIEGKLTITRRQEHDGTTFMYIELNDEKAVITPFEIKICPEMLMMALTGFACQPCTFKVSNLDVVGKVRERENISFMLPPHDSRKQKEVAIEEAKKYTPEGWTASEYYGSKGSFNHSLNGVIIATTSILRWVDRV